MHDFSAPFIARRQFYGQADAISVLGLAICVLAVAGCATSRMPSEPVSNTDGRYESSDVQARIRMEYGRWQGTPHVLGGDSARGMDCSAFVQRVFEDGFDLTLPRTTEAQVKEGRRIERGELQPGDLVFFLPPKTRHVGIYIGNGEFTHASSSEGVTISALDESYWKKAYWTSRRVLPDDRIWTERIPSAPDSESQPPGATFGEDGRRFGW